ncbi:hypothetical protein CFPU101_03450 [Chroococcus sp. FPU101]|nr:hypothetical protein CFPU101_03450 [Chroococcus sp. FPU101]
MIHDAKDSGSDPSPRISLLQIPSEQDKLRWQALPINWPKSLGISKDLESITAIPETNLFLIAESGDKKNYQRLFLLAYEEEVKGQCLNNTQIPQVKIIAETTWPVKVENVEAIAVTKINNQYLFLYTERADSQASTEIHWTTLTLDPLKFGEFRSISFQSSFGSGKNIRQISDLAIDSQQNLYIASTYDLGNTGAFRSAIYRIGQISDDNNLILEPLPQKMGEINGLKVEGIAIQKLPSGDQIFFATDDENYGGVLRPLL